MFNFAGGKTISAEPSHKPSLWPRYCSKGPAGTVFCDAVNHT